MDLDYPAFERLCAERGKAPTTVAEEAGLTRGIASRWKAGTATASNRSIKKLADYLEVDISEITVPPPAQNVATNITGSAVMQGNSGDNVSMAYGAATGDTLTDQEQELLRIFRDLSPRGKNEMMTLAFQVEDKYKAD